MDINYVIILDFYGGYLNIIRLTKAEKQESEKYDDFESFLATLEEKYASRLKNCQWMTTDALNVYHYENGKEVSYA